jgi:hypothetical protein
MIAFNDSVDFFNVSHFVLLMQSIIYSAYSLNFHMRNCVLSHILHKTEGSSEGDVDEYSEMEADSESVDASRS